MSYVYFIGPEAALHREDVRLVKIGFTTGQPDSRRRALQCGSPVTLDLIGYIDGSPEVERAFHDTFAELRSHGEWFFLERKLADFIGYFDDHRGGHISADRLEAAIYDNIFARASSHPSMSDDAYLASADVVPMRRLFPELWRQHCADHLAIVQ